MDRTSETGILLYAQGDAFEKGVFDLRSLELIVTNFRLIVDHLLPLAIGQKTLTDRIKNEVKYNVAVNNGSLEVILNFILQNPELLLIRPDLSVNHAAYFTRESWKYFLIRSGDFSRFCMCSVVAAFSFALVRTGTFV